jgi:lipid A export ATP-binding/permease msbA
LARLILRNTALWVLDEPTSAIDAHAEEQIFATLRKVAADHMTILVSHRAWTLKHADVIHVVDHGTIVESGTYAELLGAGGRFAEIFASQIEDAPKHTPSGLSVADGAGSADDTGFTKEGAPSC